MASWAKYHGHCCTTPTEILFVHYLYFKSHRILAPCLTPFHLPLTLVSWVRKFISFIFFFPLSQHGLYPLFLLVCFPILSKSFLFTVDILYSLFTLLQHSYSHSTFIKLHSAVIAINLAVGFLKFCSHWANTFQFCFKPHSMLFPSFPLPHCSHCLSCFTYVLNFVLSLSSPWFYAYSHQLPSILPLSNIFPSFSHPIFPLSYLISIISLQPY